MKCSSRFEIDDNESSCATSYIGEDAVDLEEPPAGLEAPQLFCSQVKSPSPGRKKKPSSDETVEGATEMTKCRIGLEVTSDDPNEDQS